MLETEMAELSSAQLRLAQAQYFYESFLASCGPPRDSYFHMASNFDAFLFSIASIEDMISGLSKDELRSSEAFRFVKALRNVTTHHSVLAASTKDAKFVRPFNRHMFNSVGGIEITSARLALNPVRMRTIFDSIELARPQEKRTLDVARGYLLSLEERGTTVFLEELMQEALAAARRAVG